MPFWFFKKRSEQEIDNIHAKLDKSFSKIHEDMGKVSGWINHFHEKHGDHDKKFDNVSKRLERVEFALAELQTIMLDSPQKVVEKKHVEEVEEIIDESDGESDLMELTEAQQKLCWKIAALQKERPDEWVSLKTLAQEMYPDKDYSSVRSTVCQFTSQLEELGFIKRRRKGRQSYVCSTSKNPYKDKAKRVAVKARVAKKN